MKTFSRINRKKIALWCVEELINHDGKRDIIHGKATGSYTSEREAIHAMAQAKSRGHGALCICRNADGTGRPAYLGLVAD
jgi:hypothetical protein